MPNPRDEKLARQSYIFGTMLYFFAVYTVIIKYILPVTWATVQNTPPATYIYFWDAWWIAHIAIGWGLRKAKKGVWLWAFLLSVAEIIIIATKFFIYFKMPLLNFWHLSWLVNKTLLLAYFTFLLTWLCRREVRDLL